MNSLAEKIKTLRKNQNLSQEELAKKIEVSRRVISSIELGQSEPNIEQIIKLSDFFKVSTDYLVTGKEGTNDISEEEREILEFVRKDVDFKKAITQAANLKKKAISYLGSYKQAEHHPAV